MTPKAEADETVERIEVAKNNLRLCNDRRELVLVLGDTGHGKTTTTMFITGKPLLAKKSGPRFLIENEENKIKSSMESETLYPELYENRDSNASYYDLPGFNDTRSPSIQLTNAWATKKVADHACNGGGIKIIIVCNHSTVTPGESRAEFKNILDLVTSLIPQPSKFSQSIALVATKVAAAEDDDTVVPSIVEFLEQARRDVSRVFRSDTPKMRAAEELIDALLTQKRGEYLRIYYVKRPKTEGRMDEVPYFQETRQILLKMIEEIMPFSECSEKDFGISVSAEAKNYVQGVVEKFVEKLTQRVIQLAAAGQKEFEEAVRRSASIADLANSVNHLKSVILKLKVIYTRKQFLKVLSEGLSHLSEIEPLVRELTQLDELIDFYAEIRPCSIPNPFADWLTPLADAVECMEAEIAKRAEHLNSQTDNNLTRLVASISSAFQENLENARSKDADGRRMAQVDASKDKNVLRALERDLLKVTSFNAFVSTLMGALAKLSFFSSITDAMDVLSEDVPFAGLSQLKHDAWCRKFTELTGSTSVSLSSFEVRLNELKHESEIKAMNDQVRGLEDDIKFSQIEMEKRLIEEQGRLTKEHHEQMGAMRDKQTESEIRHNQEMIRVQEEHIRQIVNMPRGGSKSRCCIQ